VNAYHLGQEIELDVHASYGGGLVGEIVLHGRVVEIDRHLLTLLLESGGRTLRVAGVRDTSRDLRPSKPAPSAAAEAR
jgi:hypothetical protein